MLRGKGEYVLRGQIIDIFSPIEDLPVRILFDIDKIESMNLFDENNQKKINDIEEYNLIPSSEIFFDEKNFGQKILLNKNYSVIDTNRM